MGFRHDVDLLPDDPNGWRWALRDLHPWLNRPALSLLNAASHGFDNLITTFFPTDCRVCAGPVLEAGWSPVCSFCIASIPPQPDSMALCWLCGEALGMESTRFAGQFAVEGLRCTTCRLAPPAFLRAVAHAVYERELREMIHLLKYERMASLARPLGQRLAEAILQLEAEITAEAAERELLVVAVPLYPSKQRQRGYNQAELLGDAAIAWLARLRPGLRLRASHGALRRVKDTASQFNLTAKGRRRNLAGAFAVPQPALVKGRSLLLIDDIYTSGATARACSGALLRAGASQVRVATVARAQRETVALWDGDG